MELSVTGFGSTSTLPTLLSRLCSSRLRTITVKFSARAHEDSWGLTSPDLWSPIDFVLASMAKEYPHIQVVFQTYFISLMTSVQVSAIFDALSDFLHRTRAAGVRVALKCSEVKHEGKHFTRVLK